MHASFCCSLWKNLHTQMQIQIEKMRNIQIVCNGLQQTNCTFLLNFICILVATKLALLRVSLTMFTTGLAHKPTLEVTNAKKSIDTNSSNKQTVCDLIV